MVKMKNREKMRAYFHIMDEVNKIDDKTIKDIVIELMFDHDDDYILEVYNKHQKSKNKT